MYCLEYLILGLVIRLSSDKRTHLWEENLGNLSLGRVIYQMFLTADFSSNLSVEYKSIAILLRN